MPPTAIPQAPTLADLPTLRRGRVVRVVLEGPVGARLGELGLTPGTKVSFVRTAPLGDPICFRLRGVELCLRRVDAARVEIEASPEDTGS